LGIPLLPVPGGRLTYHPTAICQEALGHYELWLKSRHPEDLKALLDASNWLVETQDDNGGWICFNLGAEASYKGRLLGLPSSWFAAERTMPASLYSGMVQGQAISVLARAYAATGQEKFRASAQQAFELLRKDVRSGGVCSYSKGQVSIEEVPRQMRNTILNGWIFGMFGAWDLWLLSGGREPLVFFYRNYASLVQRLPEFDLGWWSMYDEAGNVAKPFYHRLHIDQLKALQILLPSPPLARTILHWSKTDTPMNSSKARIAYAMQWSARTFSGRAFCMRRLGNGEE